MECEPQNYLKSKLSFRLGSCHGDHKATIIQIIIEKIPDHTDA